MHSANPSPSEVSVLDGSRRNQSHSFVGELWLFVRVSGKWWLVPVLVVLLLLGVLVMTSGAWYAPFLYTLF